MRKHICGHSNFSDMKILVQWNNLWNEHVEKYLGNVLKTCSKLPHRSKLEKFIVSSLSPDFNDVFCLDHCFSDDSCVFHVMDSKYM